MQKIFFCNENVYLYCVKCDFGSDLLNEIVKMGDEKNVDNKTSTKNAIINALAVLCAALISACVTLFIFYQKEKKNNENEYHSNSCDVINKRIDVYRRATTNTNDYDVKRVYRDVLLELDSLKILSKCG